MHESSLMQGFMQQLQTLAQQNQAERVTAVRVKVGALTHFSAEHFLEHFEEAAKGTLAEGATVDVELLEDIDDPRAQDIVLDEFDITTKS